MNTQNTQNSRTDLVPGTNLTWEQAGAMAKDYARDHRGDKLANQSRRRRSRKASAKPHASLASIEAAAGWGEGSLVDFIAEERRDRRLYGDTPLYS